jgi:hypothetical protein
MLEDYYIIKGLVDDDASRLHDQEFLEYLPIVSAYMEENPNAPKPSVQFRCHKRHLARLFLISLTQWEIEEVSGDETV